MIIRNTDVEARHPWPDDMHVQGGGRGMVLRSSERGGPYRTAFVETSAGGSFIRGEGATITEAEDRCWVKYQAVLVCSGSPDGTHGPYEPRHYTNGCGYCVGCGSWFTGVCEPSIEHKIDSVAGQRLRARHGRGWHSAGHTLWKALVEHESAAIRHELGIGPEPGPAPEISEADQARITESNTFWARERGAPDPEAVAEFREFADQILTGMTNDLPEGP